MFLRPFQLGDIDDVQIFAADSDVVKYLSWGPNTIEQTKAWLKQAVNEPFRHFAVVECGRVVGCGEVRVVGVNAYLTYILAKDQWNKGKGKKLFRLLVSKAIELDVENIYVAVDIDNKASIGVAKSCSCFNFIKEEEYELKGQIRRRLWFCCFRSGFISRTDRVIKK